MHLAVFQGIGKKRKCIFVYLLQSFESRITLMPVFSAEIFADFVKTELPALLDELHLTFAMSDRLLDNVLQTIMREGRFKLLLNFTSDVRKLTVANAVINKLALLDECSAGYFSNSRDKALRE
ncbi:hypothetical protein D3C76_1160600 [compost metagenome]